MLALEFGKRLREVREAEEMSRPVFGSLLELPPTTIKNYELGYRTACPASLIAKLADEVSIVAAFYVLTGMPCDMTHLTLNGAESELTFIERLKWVRENQSKYTNRPDFAKALGFIPTTYKNYELGYRHTAAEVILGLYNAFGANIAFWVLTGQWLLGETKPVWQIIESGYTYFDGNIVTVKEFKTLR